MRGGHPIIFENERIKVRRKHGVGEKKKKKETGSKPFREKKKRGKGSRPAAERHVAKKKTGTNQVPGV